MKRDLEMQGPEVVCDMEDEIYLRSEAGELIQQEVTDDDADPEDPFNGE